MEERRRLLSIELNADPILENNTWKTISEVARAGKGANFWKVGDTKMITLHGFSDPNLPDLANLKVYAKIIGINHNIDNMEGMGIHFQIGNIVNAAKTDIAFVTSNYNSKGSTTGFRMNTSATNLGGWYDSYMRNTICPLFFDQCLPEDLKAVIQPCVKFTIRYTPTSTVNYPTQDKIWLLSEFEILGKTQYSKSSEASRQAQYDYYKNMYASGGKPYRYKHDNIGSKCTWWLRSPTSTLGENFCCITGSESSGGNNSAFAADYSYGFSPCFGV